MRNRFFFGGRFRIRFFLEGQTDPLFLDGRIPIRVKSTRIRNPGPEGCIARVMNVDIDLLNDG